MYAACIHLTRHGKMAACMCCSCAPSTPAFLKTVAVMYVATVLII